MPLFLMYHENHKLATAVQGQLVVYVVLITMVVYFGFFFANFLTSQLTGGDPIVLVAGTGRHPLRPWGRPLTKLALADEEEDQHGHGGDDAGGEDDLPLALATCPN